jgi:hypothetical protein
MRDLDVVVAETVRSTSTRRGFLGRAMRWTVGVSAASIGGLAVTGTADAANCSYYGETNEWGCSCNPATPDCPGNICGSTGAPAAGYKRCDFWTHANSQGDYCWCSIHCYWGSELGYFTCCDGFTTFGSGCDRTATHCLCPQWHAIEG